MLLFLIVLLFSCSSLGEKNGCESEVVSKNTVVEKGIEEVSEKVWRRSQQKKYRSI